MPLARRLFAFLLFGVLAAAAAADDPSKSAAPKSDGNWTGQTVLGKKPDERISFFDEVDGKRVPLVFRSVHPIRVRADRDGRLRLSNGAREGWVDKNDFLLSRDAPAYFTERLRINPKDSWSLVMRGSSWHSCGDWDKAIQDYTEALRLNPNNSWALINRGISRSNKKQFAEAVNDYTEALRIDPKSAAAVRGRGRAYMELDEPDKAIQDFTEAVRLDPDNARAFDLRGQTRLKKREYDKAVRDFTEVTILTPDDPGAYDNRGLAWYQKGQYDRAIEDYTEAIRLNPRFALAFNHRGLARVRKREYQLAIGDYDEAVRLEPGDATHLFFRGQARRLNKEFEAALRDYDEAIRLNPKYDAPVGQKAYILAACRDDRLRDGEKAVELATKACEMSGWKNGFRLDALAAAYAEVGDFAQALKWAREAEKDPAFKESEGRNVGARIRLYQQGRPYRE
jgi:tetratricopeptide (TPR) repeat protein